MFILLLPSFLGIFPNEKWKEGVTTGRVTN